MENTSGLQFAKWDFRSCMLLDMHPIWFQMKREREKKKISIHDTHFYTITFCHVKTLQALPEWADSLPWWLALDCLDSDLVLKESFLRTVFLEEALWGSSPPCSFEEAVFLLDMFITSSINYDPAKIQWEGSTIPRLYPAHFVFILPFIWRKCTSICTSFSVALSFSSLFFFLFEKFTAAECSKENTDNTSQSDELNISWYITVVSHHDDDMIPELQIQQGPQKSEGKGRYTCSLINNLAIP